jgi:hypothetical protein
MTCAMLNDLDIDYKYQLFCSQTTGNFPRERAYLLYSRHQKIMASFSVYVCQCWSRNVSTILNLVYKHRTDLSALIQ